MVRALRARLKSNNCGSRTAGEVLFFARAKKSTQKKARPDGATSPCASHRAQNTRLGLEHEARDFSGTGCDARARHTGFEQNPALPEFCLKYLAMVVGPVNTAQESWQLI
jgi:hypothetical protein